MTHHAGARHFAKSANMRQARGTIAGLEQHLALACARDARHDLAGFLKRPGIGIGRRFDQ